MEGADSSTGHPPYRSTPGSQHVHPTGDPSSANSLAGESGASVSQARPMPSRPSSTRDGVRRPRRGSDDRGLRPDFDEEEFAWRRSSSAPSHLDDLVSSTRTPATPAQDLGRRSVGASESVKALVDDTIAELEPDLSGWTPMWSWTSTRPCWCPPGTTWAPTRCSSARAGHHVEHPEGQRAVAAFSREAIQFASRDSRGNLFASLDAGDLHVLVVEVDHVRLLTLLFAQKPEPPAVLEILAAYLDDYRGAR